MVENIGIEILTGPCGSLTSLECTTGSLSENASVSGLTEGEAIFVRIWGDGTEGEMNLCFSTPPANDVCANAVPLLLDVNCTNPTLGFTNAATVSPEGTCTTSGGANGQDVWFSFDGSLAGSNGVAFVVEEVNSSFAPVLEVFSSATGSCTDLVSLACDSDFEIVSILIDNVNPTETYFLRVWESFSDSPGEFTICASEPPANDACDGATVLDVQGACQVPLIATNVGMSDSPEGTCTTGGGTNALDAWFTATIPASGHIVIETSVADVNPIFDTVMEVMTGTDCTNLTLVECDDDDGIGSFSKVEIVGGTPGEQLFIRVWEFSNNSFGNFEICAFSPVPNDECVDAIALPIGSSFEDCNYQTFSAAGATESATFAACGDFDDDVWFSFVATSADIVVDVNNFVGSSGELVSIEVLEAPCDDGFMTQFIPCRLNTPNVLFGLTIGTTYFVRVASPNFEDVNFLNEFDICLYELVPPTNDECINAINLPITELFNCTINTASTTAGATTDGLGSCVLNGGDSAGDVWFSATVPPTGTVGFKLDVRSNHDINAEILMGDCTSGFTSMACEQISENGMIGSGGLVAGNTVFLRIWNGPIGFAADGVFFDICAFHFPNQDECENAVFINPLPAPCSGNLAMTNFSTFSGIGTCATGGGTVNAEDIWFETVIPSTGRLSVKLTTGVLEITTALSGVLEVFSGTGCGDLTSIACSDVSEGEYGSVILDDRTPGESIWIRVWEFDSNEPGSISLCLTELPSILPNNECINAINLDVNTGFCANPVTAVLADASSHSGEGTCTLGQGDIRPDLWYSVVVPASGDLVVETMNSGDLPFNNTAMEILEGTCGSLVSLACDDDGSVDSYSKLDLTGLTAGETLFVRVWNAAGLNFGGSFFICAYEPTDAIPINDECFNAIPLAFGNNSCSEVIVHTANATDSTPLVGTVGDLCINNFNGADLWYTIAAPANFSTVDYALNMLYTTMPSLGIEMYHGTCDDLTPLFCTSVDNSILPLSLSFSAVEILLGVSIEDLFAQNGLSPGDPLFLRFWSGDGMPGTLATCLEATSPCVFELDEDADFACDDVDNCLGVFNPDQADNDGDGIGNACDPTPGEAIRGHLTVFLEGAYDNTTGNMTTILSNNELIPLNQPFGRPPWNYNGTESVASLNDIPANATDWLLIELRNATDDSIIEAQRAVFLLNDGTVQDIDGNAGAFFTSLSAGDYFIIVRSRNHLAIMSSVAVTLGNTAVTAYDFSIEANVLGGEPQVAEVDTDVFAMLAGDFESGGTITVADFNLFNSQASAINSFVDGDANLDGNVTVIDFNLFQPNSSAIGVQQVRY